MANDSTKLEVRSRDAEGSRAARRLRRTGRVPGVLYGGGGESLGFDVDARELRLALARSGAVLDLSIDGAKATPVVLKEAQRHPVRGETVHVDLLRVRLDQAIHAVVPLELTGVDDAPGVKEGGILEQIVRELNVEALPTAIPESIVHEVGEMQIGDTIGLERSSCRTAWRCSTRSRRQPSPRSPRRSCRPRQTSSKPRPSSSARARMVPRLPPRAGSQAAARTPAARSSSPCDGPLVVAAGVAARTAGRSTG